MASLRLIILLLICTSIFTSCTKQDQVIYPDSERTITISDKIKIDNGVNMKNPVFNYMKFEDFLRHITSSDHFLIVPLKDFKNTTSLDKVVIALRHDVDDNINSAVKFAYREHKYGISASFFVLHTAKYYGKITGSDFERNENLIFYLKKLQDTYGQEIGLHNDLVTLQLIYNIPPREYLRHELYYLRSNDIKIEGTACHGSPYCYIYNYSNSFFWKDFSDPVEYVKKGLKIIKIERDSLKSFDFKYEGALMNEDYFFSDSYFEDGKRWNMDMVNFDTIKPGKKVIILLHPQHWNGDY